MGGRELFIGNGLQAIDGKSRVGLPADLRTQMEANSAAKKLYIDYHEAEDCLVAFDSGFVQRRYQQIESDEAFERNAGKAFDRALALSNPFASAEPSSFDASGRFILPPYFRGEFDDLAFFFGALDYIEIWKPEKMLASSRAAPKAKRVCEWLLKQRGRA